MSGVVVITPSTTTVTQSITQSASTSTITATVTTTTIPDNGGVFLNTTTQIVLIVILAIFGIALIYSYRQFKQVQKQRDDHIERERKEKDIEKLTRATTIKINNDEEV
jgi:beta-lactamase regulating signal transducer with metallopeptidase domain